MNKKKIITLISIIVILLLIAFMIIIKIANKKPAIQLKKGMAIKYFSTEINIKSFNDNKIEYELKVLPAVEDIKQYKDVKIRYVVILFGKIIKNDHEIKRPIKFETEEIKIKEDGTYQGTFTYDLGENEFNEINEEYKIFAKESSGTIK